MDAEPAIYDPLRALRCDVAALRFGLASSLSDVLLADAAPEERTILPNARVMIHHRSGGLSGNVPDLAVAADETLTLSGRL